MKRIFYLVLISLSIGTTIDFAQFGQNKVNYKDLDWYYIQTKHFDIYFAKGGEKIAEFAASAAEDAVRQIQKDVNYQLNNRVTIIVYNSHNDFSETNVTDEYFTRGTGGFTEPFKNRVVFPFEGSYKKFQHVIAHELVHAVMRDMYYGGTIQNIIAKGITLQLPTWFWEGSAEFISQGWETNTDMFIRNAITSETLPDINQLNGYLAYRGGQSLFKYIADTYGRQKVGELMNKIQNLGGLEPALKASIGIGLEDLNERWKKSLKKEYWPDVATRQDPDEFSKRLTDNKKDHGFYNTSPSISPQGDKIAFISDRDIYLDVYIMDAQDGKILKKVVESGKTNNFEELTVLNPSIAWSPDNIRIALSSKSGGYDVISIINTETGNSEELPFRMPGIESVSWSRDGNKIAFAGHNSSQSDIYVYDFTTKKVTNITDDIFSDSDPVWTPDGKKIIFSSDREAIVSPLKDPNDFSMYKHNYKQLDLYLIDVDTKKIDRITDWQLSDEKYAAVSQDGKEILFVSDKNGINNIYRKKIYVDDKDSVKTILAQKAIPITNSISDLGQISTSYDGKKLTFTALYNLGYNVFMINNPFDMKPDFDSLKVTDYMAELINAKNKKEQPQTVAAVKEIAKDSLTVHHVAADSTKSGETTIFAGQYVTNKKDKADSLANDYSKYVFTSEKSESDSARVARRNQLFHETLDKNGNFLVNKYKINFSPDLIYANAGYSTLYGLLGTTVLSFSDVLGNHRLIGETSLQIDIKNSDYGLAYYYLKERLDLGIQAFHTARFLYRDTYFGSDLYRFTNTSVMGTASYPFDRFHRMDFGLSLMDVTSDNLDNLAVPSDHNTFLIPSVSYVQDNVLWGYTSPIEGTRYNLTVFGDPGFLKKSQSFYSFVFDYRNYFRFWFDNGFVFRLSGGFSGGGNPQRFFIGGTENWINRVFSNNSVPISNAADFAFLTPALPLRGYDYAEKIGTKYALLNLEFRIPIIRYLLTGGLPLFFQNILGVAFIDAGSAWDNTSALKLIGRNDNGNIVTKDMLLGTGVGFRVYMLFLWRIDIAWKYNLDGFSKPRYYVSLGLDF
ncbi:MAG: peptidase MA family metallohydrolase [Bacteroidetes bacterium]|nr:peptidase MA family metallohydrolase [Bacteroidota bacterium]